MCGFFRHDYRHRGHGLQWLWARNSQRIRTASSLFGGFLTPILVSEGKGRAK